MSKISEMIALADKYYGICQKYAITKNAVIKKLPNGKYRVESEKGKNLGTFPSEEQAKKRLKQVEFFKHIKKKKSAAENNVIDLSDLDDLSYSSIMRELRQYDNEEMVRAFLSSYKDCFDRLTFAGIDKPGDKALPIALILFSQCFNIKLGD